MKVQYRMNTIFMNFENSAKSDLHILLCNLSDKIHFKRCDKDVVLSNISIYHTRKA